MCTYESVPATYGGRQLEVAYASRNYCFVLYALHWPAAEGHVECKLQNMSVCRG